MKKTRFALLKTISLGNAMQNKRREMHASTEIFRDLNLGLLRVRPPGEEPASTFSGAISSVEYDFLDETVGLIGAKANLKVLFNECARAVTSPDHETPTNVLFPGCVEARNSHNFLEPCEVESGLHRDTANKGEQC